MAFEDISIFSSGGHFVQQSRMVCAILVGVWTSGSDGDVIKSFLFLALVAILFSRAELFVQFW